jgi:hypothetical protein
MKTVTIELGGNSYEITQLPIGTLREIDAEFADTPLETLSKREKETFYFDQAVNIIFSALKSKNPTITRENILSLPSEMTEIFAAREKVLRHAGLIVDRAQPVGEGRAVAS